MSDDILRQVAAEFYPKSLKESLVLLAAEAREQNRTVKRIEEHLATLNGTVAKNVLEIARIEAVLKEREAAGWPEGDGRRKIYVPRNKTEWAQFMPWAITVVGSVMYAMGCSLGWW